MSKLTGIELKRAQLVPSAVFASPEAVVRTPELTVLQKIAILRRWEFDLRRNLRAPAVSYELRLREQVHLALASLGVVAAPQPADAERPRH
jgi:hypothetical protein